MPKTLSRKVLELLYRRLPFGTQPATFMIASGLALRMALSTSRAWVMSAWIYVTSG